MPWHTCTPTSCTVTSSPRMVRSDISVYSSVHLTDDLDSHRRQTADTSVRIKLCSMIRGFAVLLDAEGRAKVCDFGIARFKDRCAFRIACKPVVHLRSLHATGATERRTRHRLRVTLGLLKKTPYHAEPCCWRRTFISTKNGVAGTPSYMAPEMFEGGPVTELVDVRPVSQHAGLGSAGCAAHSGCMLICCIKSELWPCFHLQVYSFGVLMWECLTGVAHVRRRLGKS